MLNLKKVNILLIQRVITEYEELNDKIGKLNKFINANPFFKKLDAENTWNPYVEPKEVNDEVGEVHD